MNKPSKTTNYDNANLFYKLYCLWIIPCLLKFYKFKALEHDDLEGCAKHDRAANIVQLFNSFYAANKQRSSFHNATKSSKIISSVFRLSPFLKSLLQCFLANFWIPFFLFVVQDCLIKPFQPIFIGVIIRYFYDNEVNSGKNYFSAVLSAIALCLSSLFLIASHHPSLIYSIRLSTRFKILWSSLIYSNALRLKSTSNQFDIPKFINLINNDLRRFDEFAVSSNYLLIVPIQTLLIMCVAWYYIGASCLATMIAFLGLACLFSGLQKKFASSRSKSHVATDRRMKIFTEIIRSLKAIKIYALESRFLKNILDARKNEVQKLRAPILGKSCLFSFSMISHRVIMFFSFSIYLLFLNRNEKFNPETVFVSVALFDRLRYCLTWSLPVAFSGLQEVLFSCARLEDFLKECDKQVEVYKENECIFERRDNIVDDVHIRAINLTSKPIMKSSNCARFQLKNIDLELKKGQIISVIGPVACGKSILLCSFLNEIPLQSSSELQINGKLSYVSQETFTIQDTIRNNILFGQEYQKGKYQNVLKACALDFDLDHFPNHDLTFVDEAGQNLSGGQRARINLARALYCDSDIYLLDDIFSAVDSHLCRHIYEHCVEYLVSHGKSVIIATHQLQFLPKSDHVLLMDKGQSLAYGTFEHLMASNEHFSKFFNLKKQSVEEANKSQTHKEYSHSNSNVSANSQELSKPGLEKKILEKRIEQRLNNWNPHKDHDSDSTVRSYLSYFQTGSLDDRHYLLVILFISCSVMTQVLLHGCDYWLTLWNSISLTTSNSSEDFLPYRFLLIYAAITVGIVIFSILRSVTFYNFTSKVSNEVHDRIVERLVQAPLYKVQSFQIGTLLSCFSRDVGVLDETFPNAMFELILAAFQVLTVLTMILTINSWMTSLTIIYFLALFITRRYFAVPANRIRAFEITARNNVIQILNSTLRGVKTIRAYDQTAMFEKRFFGSVDDHTAIFSFQYAVSRFFCQLVDLFAFSYILAVLAILFLSTSNASLVAPCLGSILTLIGVVQWAFKRSIDTDLWIASYDNLEQFQSLPIEDTARGEQVSGGFESLTFEGAAVCYYQSETDILDKIDLNISRGEKIGICGRSGSGKSTLINALLGFCNIRKGKVLFNNKDITHLSLAALRRRISIIPQVPIIFSGSVRHNVDIFYEYSDDEIWSALKKVQLSELVMGFENGLDEILEQNSIQLSLGQKQLLCLARILIQNNDLIVLDESTAAMDFHTDQLIQTTIRTIFHTKTVITIAHRLDSIIDSDRILVFSNGRIVEDGPPRELLEKADGEFTSLIQQTGSKMSQRLIDHVKCKTMQ